MSSNPILRVWLLRIWFIFSSFTRSEMLKTAGKLGVGCVQFHLGANALKHSFRKIIYQGNLVCAGQLSNDKSFHILNGASKKVLLSVTQKIV